MALVTPSNGFGCAFESLCARRLSFWPRAQRSDELRAPFTDSQFTVYFLSPKWKIPALGVLTFIYIFKYMYINLDKIGCVRVGTP